MNIDPKRHLHNLPEMEEHQVPKIEMQPSKKGLVLLPIFEGRSDKNDTAHHVVMSAIWARRSWMLYTDVVDHGIEVKYYVEDRVFDVARDIFSRNFVDREDVLIFNGQKLEGVCPDGKGGYITEGIKKAASYNDYRFKDYDWIFDVDSDIFVMSPNREKLPFFRLFFDTCKDTKIGACWPNFRDTPPYPTPESIGWASKIEDWRERFESLSSSEMADMFFDPARNFLVCNGGIVALPAKHLMNNDRETCEFLVKACRELLDVEAALSLYASFGHEIFDVLENVQICLMHIHRGGESLTDFERLFVGGDPFLFHYSTCYIGYYFQKGIGIDDQ